MVAFTTARNGKIFDLIGNLCLYTYMHAYIHIYKYIYTHTRTPFSIGNWKFPFGKFFSEPNAHAHPT